MELIFEIGHEGRGLDLLPECDVPAVTLNATLRKQEMHLPEVSETELSRHYTKLAKRTHGVNDGFYPLGSCTMKYNPKVNEEMAALPGFTNVHPLAPQCATQGSMEVIYELQNNLGEITGMDAFTLQPAAGAHGEFTGLLLIKSYHKARNDEKRTKIIVPDSAHGTNPASATMAGFDVVSIASGEDGCVDLDALRAAVGEDTAGLMLTNPNTVGIFDKNILEITKIIHEAGGLCYYDGANLNAIMGQCRPGDMGFDCVHLNLHKTFSTPHGGGGPGSGPVGCKAFLADYLPGRVVSKKEDGFHFEKPSASMGELRSTNGNFLVMVKALTYITTLGAKGIAEASQNAVLNANYMRVKLAKAYDMAYDVTCMHEFVMTLERQHKEINIAAMDIAKAMLDYGIHPPTMYFPLIVHEALMVEPTETETKEEMDHVIDVLLEIMDKAQNDPEYIRQSPHKTVISRPDEVNAARNPIVAYEFQEKLKVMVKTLKAYCADSFNPYENLALEEVLTYEVGEEECILYLWQNQNTVVIGKNQNAYRECQVTKLENDGGFLARRLSGGGAVFHDLGNLNFTFCVRKDNYDLDRQLNVIIEACKSFGLNATKTGRNDVVIDERKFSGNAFFSSGDYAYHHGTLLLHADTKIMQEYLNVSNDKLQSKGVTSVKSRVVNLTELNDKITVESMKKAMIEAFEKEYKGKALMMDLEKDLSEEAKEKRKKLTDVYGSEEWKFGEKTPFTNILEHRFAFGEFQFHFEVVEGKIKECKVFSDCLDISLPQNVEKVFIGCPYRQKEIHKIAEQIDNPEYRDKIEEIVKWVAETV